MITKIDHAKSEGESMTGEGFCQLWTEIFTVTAQLGRDFDRLWRQRYHAGGAINSQFLIAFIFKLVLSKTKQGYGLTLADLWTTARQARVALPQTKPFSASSVCEARTKLDPQIFRDLNTAIIDRYSAALSDDALFRWHGCRLFVVDGSKINLPAELKKNGWSLVRPEAHYPQGLLSCLYRLGAGLPYDFSLNQHGDERQAAGEHLACLNEADIVIYDRGYFSYELAKQHCDSRVDAIFRLQGGSQSKVIADFMADPNAGDDVVVTLSPSPENHRRLRRAHPDLEITPISLRLIRYAYEGVTHFLATTLFEQKFCATEFVDVYHSRWGVEELYKTYKVSIDVEDFHAKSERGVRQEVFAAFVLVTMTRLLTNQAEGLRNANSSEVQGGVNSVARGGSMIASSGDSVAPAASEREKKLRNFPRELVFLTSPGARISKQA